MDRRAFNKLAGLAAIGSVAGGSSMRAQNGPVGDAHTGLAGEVVLEDEAILVSFDERSGALTRLVRKSTNWVVERRPELGASFRLLVPLPGRRANFVLGQKQRAARVEKIAENKVESVWKNPMSEHGGALPITLTATTTL